MNSEDNKNNGSEEMDIEDRVEAIKQKKAVSQEKKYREISDLIWEYLNQRGIFYRDENDSAYFFLKSQKILVPVALEHRGYRHIVFDMGINPKDKLFPYLMHHLQERTSNEGEKATIHRFCYFNPETFTVYLFNNKDQVYKIPPTSVDHIEVVDNGTDGVLFLSNEYEPLDLSLDKLDGDKTFDKIILENVNFQNGPLSANEQRDLFMMWFYSLFFESIMATKPILALVGDKGSGKTTALRMILQLLFGRDAQVTTLTSDIKDFDAAVTNNEVVVFDNIDEQPKWLNERMAVCSTGGKIIKRILYTTNEQGSFKIRCYVAFTSLNPYKFKEDVASRLLLLRLKPLDSFRSETEFQNEINQNRNAIMSYIMADLQQFAHCLQKHRDYKIKSSVRFADFASFVVKAVRDNPLAEKVIEELFMKLSDEQAMFDFEKDDLLQALEFWAIDNPGREVTSAELFPELLQIARAKHLNLQIPNQRTLAQKLARMTSVLNAFFEFNVRDAGGRKRYYSFKILETDSTKETTGTETGESNDFTDSMDWMDEEFEKDPGYQEAMKEWEKGLWQDYFGPDWRKIVEEDQDK